MTTATPGATPWRLTTGIMSGMAVEAMKWSPDSTRLAFVGDTETGGIYEAWTVPISGASAPAKVSGTIVSGGNVSTGAGISWTPDGGRVIFVADRTTDEVYELFSSDARGGVTPRKLSGTLTTGGDVAIFAVTSLGH